MLHGIHVHYNNIRNYKKEVERSAIKKYNIRSSSFSVSGDDATQIDVHKHSNMKKCGKSVNKPI